jgi:hypothetical protein
MQDSLIIGVVLFLLIAALGVYMWLRFQQIETRLNIADSILLDMKMVMQSVSQFPGIPFESIDSAPVEEGSNERDSSEMGSNERGSNEMGSSERVFTERPSTPASIKMVSVSDVRRDQVDTINVSKMEDTDADSIFPSVVDEIKREMASAANDDAAGDLLMHPMASPVMTNDYYGMTLKDLRSLAKSRGVTGTGSMNRDKLVSVLREKDTESSLEPSTMEYESFDTFSGAGSDDFGSPVDAPLHLQE